jgi:hypothetical protein
VTSLHLAFSVWNHGAGVFCYQSQQSMLGRKRFFFYRLAVAAGCTMRVPVRPNDRIRDGRMQPVSVTLVDRGSMRKLNSPGRTSCAPTTAPGRFFAQESVWRLAGPERQPNCSFSTIGFLANESAARHRLHSRTKTNNFEKSKSENPSTRCNTCDKCLRCTPVTYLLQACVSYR